MFFKRLSIHVVLLVVCTTTMVVCMKKDKFYCQKSSECTCVSPNNIIDLHELNINMSLAANEVLHFQPCSTDGHNTSSVDIEVVNPPANETSNATTTIIPIAYYKDVQFEIGDAVVLVYANETNKFEVTLSCDPLAVKGHEFLTDFRNDTTNHSMITLKTSIVCGLNLNDAIENSSSHSLTSFFSFLLFVAFIYFVGGSVVNACLYNEIGINMIPHHVFWSSLCNNIKEKLCGSSTMASTYESI